jgi:hypothetical protein
MFMGSRPNPQPKWGYGVAQNELHRLLPLREVVQWVIRGGFTGADLLQTFISCRNQPLR